MAIIQIRQAPNAVETLTGNPPMLRQTPNATDNLTGRPAMIRQDPPARDNLIGKPPMRRQDPPSKDNLSGNPPMLRQGAETVTTDVPELNGTMLRYDGSSTSTPPAAGFALPPDSSNTIGPQVRQTQNNSQTILRDYNHAARIFGTLTNDNEKNFRLSPKYGFLFYVEFDFNPLITEISNQAAQELGMIVKNVSLPKFTIDTKIHNAYNRKNIVQNKISYDQVNITFHDDQADNVRQFWYDYYSFFYRDPDYADSTYSAPHKYQSRPSFDWGYTPRPTAGYASSLAAQPYQYIQAIRIYSLYQQQFSEYELVNPIITSFKHGEHSNSDNNLMEHSMSVQFETVKYQTGYVTQNTVGGFIDLHYDNRTSPNGTNTNETAPGTYPDSITDLANNQTAINPNIRTDNALASVTLSATGGFASAFGTAIGASAGVSLNSGGFSIPSLGSLRQGVPSAAALGQQLEASAVGLVGRTAGTLANGVVGGLANGLGSNGRSIIGLAAAAISNPSAALRTAENMALSYGTRLVSNYVSNQANQLANYASSQISSFVGENITQPLSQAFGDATAGLSNSFGEFTSSFSFGGTDSADTAALFSDSSAYDAGAGWSS